MEFRATHPSSRREKSTQTEDVVIFGILIDAGHREQFGSAAKGYVRKGIIESYSETLFGKEVRFWTYLPYIPYIPYIPFADAALPRV